jgi:hypothetical protein
MPRSRLVLVLVFALSLALPITAVAQGTPPHNGPFAMSASLSGGSEVPGPGDWDGFGFARVTIDLATGELCYRLSVARVDDISASHIHIGAAGEAGPVVVPLDPPVSGLSSGCTPVGSELAAAIVSNPAGYYVNVHSAENPSGAVRGQLAPVNYTPFGVEPVGPNVDVVAEGLTFPHGMTFGPDGALYLVEGGSEPAPGPDDCVTIGEGEEASEYCFVNSGTIQMVHDGEQTVVADGLPNTVSDITVSASGEVYVLTGLGGDIDVLREAAGDKVNGYGALLEVDLETNTWTVVADVSDYETDANPDGGPIDSNPYSMVMVDDGFVVVDAGMNAVVYVTEEGDISTVAVFPPQMVDAPPFLELPPGTQIPMEAVPTDIAQGPDGAWYVSELSGFPFELGSSRIWRLDDTNGDADAMDDGEMTIAYTGFTNLVGLAFGSEGDLYVLSIAKEGLLAAEDPENPSDFTSALIEVGDDGSQTEIMSTGLVAASGLAIGPDDALYVANYGVMPGMGEVLKITDYE